MTFIIKRFEVVPEGFGDAFAFRTDVFAFQETSPTSAIGQSSKFNVDAATMMRYDAEFIESSELNGWLAEMVVSSREEQNVYPFTVKVGILEYDGLWNVEGFTLENYARGDDLPIPFEANGDIIAGKMWQDDWIGEVEITDGNELFIGSILRMGEAVNAGVTHTLSGSLANIKSYLKTVHVSGEPLGLVVCVPDRPDVSLQRIQVATEWHEVLGPTVLELLYAGSADGTECIKESVGTRARMTESVAGVFSAGHGIESTARFSRSVGGEFSVTRSVENG